MQNKNDHIELLSEILPEPSNEVIAERFVADANEAAGCNGSCSGSCAGRLV